MTTEYVSAETLMPKGIHETGDQGRKRVLCDDVIQRVDSLPQFVDYHTGFALNLAHMFMNFSGIASFSMQN